ncbi:MAG: hypothetical protein ACLFTR_05535 [Candidatus Woesearchaeota archaeon]
MVPKTRDFEHMKNFVEVRDVDIDDERLDIMDIPEDMDFVDPVEIEDFDD